MSKFTSAMKLTGYLTSAAIIGLGIFSFGLLLGVESVGAYAMALSALLLVGVIRDYSPRRSRWEPSSRPAPARFPSRAHVIRRAVAPVKLVA